tara:strand:+ start:769 stop:1056 length:288 start_codon:yes stop_codon:yes gene_type:complete
MKSWFELNHLRIADSLNNRPKKNILFLYFTHMIIGIREACKQFLMALASLIHAFLPPLFNFKLLEMVINQAIGLHKYLPQHPDWKKLKNELNKDS